MIPIPSRVLGLKNRQLFKAKSSGSSPELGFHCIGSHLSWAIESIRAAKLLCDCDTIFHFKVLICFLDRTWLNKATSTTSGAVSWSHRLACYVSSSGVSTYSKSKVAQLSMGEGCSMLSELKVSLYMCAKRHKCLLVPLSSLHNDTFPILNQIFGKKFTWQQDLKICWKPQKMASKSHFYFHPLKPPWYSSMQRIQCLRGVLVCWVFFWWQRGNCISLHALSTWTQEVQKARSIPDREGKGGGSEKHGDRPRRQTRKFWLKRKCFNIILKTFCYETPCLYREVKEKQLSADSAVWRSHPATHRLLSLSLKTGCSLCCPCASSWREEPGSHEAAWTQTLPFRVYRLLVSFWVVSRSNFGMLTVLQ